MKRQIFIILFLMFSSLLSWASDDEIVLNHTGQQHDHTEHYLPADAPEAFFDSDEMEIIIEADGFASYYIVEIISMVTYQSMVYTQIGGYGDNIDISSFPPGYYRLEITSSNNNEYEGYFTVE